MDKGNGMGKFTRRSVPLANAHDYLAFVGGPPTEAHDVMVDEAGLWGFGPDRDEHGKYCVYHVPSGCSVAWALDWQGALDCVAELVALNGPKSWFHVTAENRTADFMAAVKPIALKWAAGDDVNYIQNAKATQ